MPEIPTIALRDPGAGGGVAGRTASPTAGKGLAQAGHEASVGLLNAAMKIKDQQDTAKAGEAFNAYRGASSRVFVGLKSTEGSDAVGVLDKLETWNTEWETENSELLVNDRQREIFEELRAPHYANRRESVSFHAAAEHKKRLDGVAVDNVARGRAEIALDPFSDATYAQAEKVAIDSLHAANPGGKNVAAVMSLKADMAAIRAKSMMDIDADLAMDFINKEKAKLGGAYAPLKVEIENKQLRQREQFETDTLMREVPTFEERIKKAQKITDPKVRDGVVSRLKVREQEEIEFKKRRDQKITDGVAKYIDEAPSLTKALEAAGSAPEHLVKKLEKYARATRGAEIAAAEYLAVAKAREGIDDGTIKTREQLGVEYWPLVGKKRASLEKYFDERGNKGQIKDNMLISAISARKTGFKPKDREADSQLLQEARESVERNLEPGQAPTEAVVNDLVSMFLMSGESIGEGVFGGDANETYGEAVKKGRANVWLPNVEDREVEQLTRELTAGGDKVTDLNMKLHKRVYWLKRPWTAQTKAMYIAQEPEKGLRGSPVSTGNQNRIEVTE